MSTEKWIALCAVFAVLSLFAGAAFNDETGQRVIDDCMDREREYERAWDSLDRRDKEWQAAFAAGRAPNPPPRYEPYSGNTRHGRE